ALAHEGSRRWLLVGFGARERWKVEGARVCAAKAAKRAAELGTKSLCWELPAGADEAVAEALVEGTILASYRFDRYKQEPSNPAEQLAVLEELIVSAPTNVEEALAHAQVTAEAANAART